MAKWDKIATRGRVIDRRGQRYSGMAGIGSFGLMGIVGILAFSVLTGGEVPVDQIFQQLESAQVQTQQVDSTEFEGADDYEVFVSTVLGSNNSMWEQIFSSQGRAYADPELVLFRGRTQSSCGGASSQTGPHYCPVDKTIYIDETFFDELQSRFGAQGGDVAEAYVIAHEVGHHVQNELGIIERTNEQRVRNPSEANELSIKQELQADCFAGLWAHSIRDAGIFEAGEIREAIDAAEAVGDDRIQEKVQGRINSESWTHGSSEDRVKWFTLGYNSGDVGRCDTF